MTFVTDAIRTKSDKFYPENISLASFLDVIDEMVTAGNDLDLIKKSLFYNKAMTADKSLVLQPDLGEKDLEELNEIVPVDILHGILGMVTEGVEMLEAILKAYDSKEPLDLVNLLEEVGDNQWYVALISHATGKPIEHIQDTVIAKLKARFPDKFTEDAAQNRDLVKEREILEAGASEGLI